jgi:hypothetical protein
VTPDADLRDLLALGDLDGLVREVDRRSARGDWDGLLALRDACLAATEETGRQLWGPARYAAYRVALEGPARLAAAMLEPGVARFGLGPLTEVVAQAHRFDELADALDPTLLPVVAQERVLRGEDLCSDPRAAALDPDAPPLVLQAFEPDYVLPTYRAAERIDGAPELRSAVPVDLSGIRTSDSAPAGAGARTGTDARTAGDAEGDADRWARDLAVALRGTVEVWETASEARIATAALVDATALDAARTVAPDLTLARPLAVPDLFALLAFAGASGGVHGPRRGGAAGRGAAWWVARVAAGAVAGSPLDPDELEYRLEDLELLSFSTPGTAAWRLQVAIADPATGAAAAVSAVEAAPAGDAGPVPTGHPVEADGASRPDGTGVRS